MLKYLFLVSFFFLLNSKLYGQGCCAGGAGSPITGGGSLGVLKVRQFEFSASYQFLNSDKFHSGSQDTAKLFENFSSNYVYSKIAYGVTKNLTISLESGYYLNKTQTGFYDSVLNKSEIIQSSGIADLIIFPRYDVLNKKTTKQHTEITLGLGYKIPLGNHTDSIVAFVNPINGTQIYTTAPPLVQPTNGSHDFIFYSFLYRGFNKSGIRVFANALYIKKGWNSLGEKFGDYSSLGLFIGKSFYDNFGLNLQLKGEHISQMQAADNIDLLAYYNVDVNSTGSTKLSFVPQFNFNYRSFNLFMLYELSLYEHVNGTQIASKHLCTAGLAYRFLIKEKLFPSDGDTIYSCSMSCEWGESNTPGKVVICGMLR